MGANLVIILGTRPEIIKLSPIIHECEKHNLSYTVVHTGQHYSDNLNSVFFDQLELPSPEYNLAVGSDSHGAQTGQMLAGIEEILLDEDPNTVLIQGDTNSVLAGAIATSKLDMQVGHVEAGLRSFDSNMPEETNRVVTDHIADYLFAPTEQSKEYLLEEGIPDSRITVTGNTVVDALYRNKSIAERKSTVLDDLDLIGENFFLMTAHRAENVDKEERFRSLLTGVSRAAEEHGVDVIYPIHPRAEAKLDAFDLSVPDNIRLLESQRYIDFLRLESAAALILTDSGGVQEEACIVGVPCVTLRDSTERPETLDVGANALAGVDTDRILSSVRTMYGKTMDWKNPFGDGNSSKTILQTILEPTNPFSSTSIN